MMQQGFGTDTNPYLYHCFWKAAIDSQYRYFALVILNVILHLRHKNLWNNHRYLKYLILVLFLFFGLLGYFWENFQYFGTKSKYYDGDLKKLEKTKKPIYITLPEGRYFSTLWIENIKKCAQNPFFRPALSYSSGLKTTKAITRVIFFNTIGI